jgi:apolipoprotein N-acyltransferase
MKLKSHVVFRGFFWLFLTGDVLSFWIRIFLYHHWVLFVFAGVFSFLAGLSYYLMCESRRYPV